MFPTGRCRNCGVATAGLLCDRCINYKRCCRCYRYLPHHLYPNDADVCFACQNLDPCNIGRYALDHVVGDRTWHGTADDMSLGDFVQRHSDDIISTYEAARVENVIIKYYLEMVVDFQRTTQDMETSNAHQPDSSSHQRPPTWMTWTWPT